MKMDKLARCVVLRAGVPRQDHLVFSAAAVRQLLDQLKRAYPDLDATQNEDGDLVMTVSGPDVVGTVDYRLILSVEIVHAYSKAAIHPQTE